jgi:poly-gamma-glutamate capsule biosynthesis protein CapA/YwtB (metallophosphatase superfamily)
VRAIGPVRLSGMNPRQPTPDHCIIVFLCGDVMTGRGIDQILPHPSDPAIYEPSLKSATGYVELAEAATGPIPRPVDFAYIWGDALGEWERLAPDARIINLETAITRITDWEDKGINYRMHPDNVACLTAARIDCCVLANNHVLDWGANGLLTTLQTLDTAHIKSAGAGRNLKEATAPAVLDITGKGRILVFAYGSETSGIPWHWAASADQPGVNLLTNLSADTVEQIKADIQHVKRPGDLVVASLHWGANWGYFVSRQQREFAHRLINDAGVHVIHGHSSHHVKGIEVYKGHLILYGCGDFLDDYEGISGYEEYRGDLSLMYFATMEPSTGKLVSLHMTPLQIRHFRANRASREDAAWLRDTLSREGKRFGTRVDLEKDNTLTLRWGEAGSGLFHLGRAECRSR